MCYIQAHRVSLVFGVLHSCGISTFPTLPPSFLLIARSSIVRLTLLPVTSLTSVALTSVALTAVTLVPAPVAPTMMARVSIMRRALVVGAVTVCQVAIILAPTSIVTGIRVTAASRVAGKCSRSPVPVMLLVLVLLVLLELVFKEVCTDRSCGCAGETTQEAASSCMSSPSGGTSASKCST